MQPRDIAKIFVWCGPTGFVTQPDPLMRVQKRLLTQTRDTTEQQEGTQQAQIIGRDHNVEVISLALRKESNN